MGVGGKCGGRGVCLCMIQLNYLNIKIYPTNAKSDRAEMNALSNKINIEIASVNTIRDNENKINAENMAILITLARWS